MAASKMKLPEGFVLDSEPNLPSGFVLDKSLSGEQIQQSVAIPSAEESAFFDPQYLQIQKAKQEAEINRAMAQRYRDAAAKIPDEKSMLVPGVPMIGPHYVETPAMIHKQELLDKAAWYEQGAPKAKPSMMPEIIGGTAGGIIGATVGHPIIGAMLGAGAGQSLYQIGQAAFGSPLAPQTSLEAAKRIGIAGTRQASLETLAGSLFRYPVPEKQTILTTPISQLVKGQIGKGKATIFGKAPTLTKSEVRAAQEYFQKAGGTLTAGQMSDSFWIDLGESMAESSIPGGGRMRAFKIGQKLKAEDKIQEIVNRLGAKTSQEHEMAVQQLINEGLQSQKAIITGQKAFRATQAGHYNKFDQLAPGGIDIKLAKEQATKIGGEYRPEIVDSLVDAKKNLRPPESLIGAIKTTDIIANLPDRVPATWWNEFEQELSRQAYVPAGELRTKEQGLMQIFKNVANDVFEKATKSGDLSEAALDALKEARRYSAQNYKIFYADIMGKLAQTQPDLFVPVVMKINNLTDIRNVKTVFTAARSDAYDKIVVPRCVTKMLTEQARIPTTGETSGKALKSLLRPPLRGGETLMREKLGSEIFDELDKMATILVQQQLKPPTKGSFLVSLRQPGAWIQLAGGVGVGLSAAKQMPTGVQAISAGFALGPPALANLFGSQTGIRLLTQGLTTRADTRIAADIAMRIYQLSGPHPTYKQMKSAYKVVEKEFVNENQN